MGAVEVKGTAAAGTARFLIPVGMPVPHEHIFAAEGAHQPGDVGAGENPPAPAMGNLGVFSIQTFPQGVADLPNQEVEGYVADPFPVFQGIGHNYQVG